MSLFMLLEEEMNPLGIGTYDSILTLIIFMPL